MNRNVADAVDGLELINQIDRQYKLLFALINELPNKAQETAKAKSEYYLEKNQESFKMKQQQGLPVSFIVATVKGQGNVPRKMFDWDFSEKMWEANLEKIYATKKYINHLEDEYKRVWGVRD